MPYSPCKLIFLLNSVENCPRLLPPACVFAFWTNSHIYTAERHWTPCCLYHERTEHEPLPGMSSRNVIAKRHCKTSPAFRLCLFKYCFAFATSGVWHERITIENPNTGQKRDAERSECRSRVQRIRCWKPRWFTFVEVSISFPFLLRRSRSSVLTDSPRAFHHHFCAHKMNAHISVFQLCRLIRIV